jgi:hypothetical protein
MKLEERQRLQEVYAQMSEQELFDMLSAGEADYEEGGFELLLEEARRRGLEEKARAMIDGLKQEKQVSQKKQVSHEKCKEFVLIFETYNAGDIPFLRSLLDAHDIEYIVEGEDFNMIRPLIAQPIVVKVNKEQLEEAEELLKDFEGGGFGPGLIMP